MLETMKPSRKRFILAIIIFVFMIGLLFGTNPNSLPLLLLLGPFILLFLSLYLFMQLILDRFVSNLSKHARRGLSATLAALPVLLLVLQSISQLTSRDLLITVGLIALLLFYFRKTDFLV
jgi:c-di-AMP phosphodiesterase-like protein